MGDRALGGGAGELVTEVLAFDGGRAVSVYLPSQPPAAIVYAGDGQLIAPWGALLAVADVPATLVVGVHRIDSAEERERLAEYSAGFDPARFAAHERFLLEEVPHWVRKRFGVALPAERTAVAGVSAGAELALALLVRHADRFEAVLAASPGGGYRPPPRLSAPLPRTYLVAGTLEPWFAENAARWGAALREAGADVVLAERVGDHGDAFWQEEFPRQVAWAFPP